MHYLRHSYTKIFILKIVYFLIWNLNWTGSLVFLFAKSGSPTLDVTLLVPLMSLEASYYLPLKWIFQEVPDSSASWLLKRTWLVAQRVKDLALLLLLRGFDPWLRNFCMLWVQPKKKKKPDWDSHMWPVECQLHVPDLAERESESWRCLHH